MGARNAGVVASRIIALYLGIEAISTIVTYLIFVRGFAGSSYFWGVIGPRLVIAWILWIVADRIGAGIARGTSDTPGTSLSLVDLLTAAFVVVGVVLLVQAIPALVNIAISDSPIYDEFAPLRFTPFGDFGGRAGLVVGELVRLGIGVALITFARPFSVALHGRHRNEPPAA